MRGVNRLLIALTRKAVSGPKKLRYKDMPSSSSNRRLPWPVAVSVRIYRGLLRFYPLRFRQEFAGQMAQVFRDCCQDAYAAKGLKGVLKLWPGVVVDLAISAAKQHKANLRPGKVIALFATYLLALGFAVLTGYVNVHNNEAQAPAALLLIFSFGFGVARPRAAWRWALIFGLAIPLSYYASYLIGYSPVYKPVPNEISTVFVLIPAFVAAYTGALIRRLISSPAI